MMIESPLDRLNYHNGQRLEASDLKLEQEYHIRVRRWLNKSLYEPGIASGLTIRLEKDKDGKNTRSVIVGPGLALDAEGREILLLEEKTIAVPGKPHTAAPGLASQVVGLYITIRYNEKSIAEERSGCIPQSANGKTKGNRAAWGGPAIVRAEPVFNWRDALPYESGGEIVLGQVEIDSACHVQLDTSVRRNVGAASDAKVRQYALEGEREVAYIQVLDETGQPKGDPIKEEAQVYFHIRGRQPKGVTLYLRGKLISSLYYTELGAHVHDVTTSSGNSNSTGQADPVFPEITTAEHEGNHEHNPTALVVFHERDLNPGVPGWNYAMGFELGAPVDKDNNDRAQQVPLNSNGTGNMKFDYLDVSAEHKHSIVRTSDKEPFSGYTHNHSYSFSISGKTDSFGAPLNARSGDALTYVNDLRIKIDGKDVTRAILEQITAADSIWFTNSKDMLGDGTKNHPLIEKGTGEIKLDFLPNISLLEGEHVIELSAPEIKDSNGKPVPNGGRIVYNLYVE